MSIQPQAHDDEPMSDCERIVAEAEKPCCKCAAYREIIAEQATKLAQAKRSFNDIRTWAPTLIRYCNEGDPK